MLLAVLVLLAAALVARCLYAFRDRNPGYTVAIARTAAAARETPRPLRVGFARRMINPDLSNPDRPVYVAGFDQNRVATAIHDDLWAVACVLDDGHTRLAVAALDAIGLFHDDVIAVRRQIAPEWSIDYAVVCTTHNHSTPDLMGLWGPSITRSGVDPGYRAQVIAATAEAIGDAVGALQPARLALHQIAVPTENLVTDTRLPEVYDPDLRVMHFTAPDSPTTIGTVVSWANHPETVWGDNTEITADFCGYLRDALERGVVQDGQTLAPGLGGIHLYVNGAIGGLMTTHPRVTVRDPYLDQEFQTPSHEKARAVGHQLASRILPELTAPDRPAADHAPISIHARTIELQLDNKGFLLAPVLGLIDRGHVRWSRLRSEIALITVGEAAIACIPGEIYPEVVNGGIEKAPGADFGVGPVEVPPLRELMPGRVKFVFGMANDEIGYIIPKSEWDREPPYLYGSPKGVYGEVNSVGPETAPAIHGAFFDLSTVVMQQ